MQKSIHTHTHTHTHTVYPNYSKIPHLQIHLLTKIQLQGQYSWQFQTHLWTCWGWRKICHLTHTFPAEVKQCKLCLIVSALKYKNAPFSAYLISHFLCFIDFTFIFKILFLAALGLHCCTRASFSFGKRGLLFLAMRGLLIAVASLVAEHGL